MTVKIIYWSGTGNTEHMAEAIAEGVKEAGAEVDLKSVDKATVDEVKEATHIAFGCPAMGDEELEELEFRPFMDDVNPLLSGKKVLLFGSYEWANGEWMEDWMDEMDGTGAQQITDGYACYGDPDDEGQAKCRELGKKLAQA